MPDNPIINLPFKEPTRYFEIVEGALRSIVKGRRPGHNLMPPPKKRRPVQNST